MNTIRWVWKCNECEDIVKSYSNLRYDLNRCQCGECYVDLEDGYCRTLGEIDIISIRQNINNEWV